MVPPDKPPDFGAGGRVLQRHVDAGFYGFVEDGDAVGGEEHDALEVFELAEEDCRIMLG